jgi:DNA-binding NtrC family response regulator
VIERACILCEKDELSADLLPFDFILNSGNCSTSTLKLSDIEKQCISKALNLTSGNKGKSAEMLGIGLTTLYAKIKEYNL